MAQASAVGEVGPVGPWRVRFPHVVDVGLDGGDGRPRATGPLAGVRVAVKDLFAVAGQRVGAGNPTVLRRAGVASRNSVAVQTLVDAGAVVAGIARTDELAFSIAGVNQHEGAVVNPRRPGFLVGGSTSGPAAAVAGGEADLGLGTDTAGSIRVPASYCGLWGLRLTHGSVGVEGLRPLAPSFDAVGLLAREPGLLTRAAGALGAADVTTPVRRIVVPAPLLDLLASGARRPFLAAAAALAHRQGPAELVVAEHGWSRAQLEAWLVSFRALQAHEAWQVNQELLDVEGAISPEVRARILHGQDVDVALQRSVLGTARADLLGRLDGDTVLCLPSTSGTAPRVATGAAELEGVRAATMRLTFLAPLAGLPAVSAPLLTHEGAPMGVSLVGAPGDDLRLLRCAAA